MNECSATHPYEPLSTRASMCFAPTTKSNKRNWHMSCDMSTIHCTLYTHTSHSRTSSSPRSHMAASCILHTHPLFLAHRCIPSRHPCTPHLLTIHRTPPPPPAPIPWPHGNGLHPAPPSPKADDVPEQAQARANAPSSAETFCVLVTLCLLSPSPVPATPSPISTNNIVQPFLAFPSLPPPQRLLSFALLPCVLQNPHLLHTSHPPSRTEGRTALQRVVTLADMA